MGLFRLQAAVAEFEGALVTGTAGCDVAPREEPARPGYQELLDVFGPGARGGCSRFAVGARHWEFAPPRCHFGGGIAQGWPVHHRPDVLRESRTDSFAS